MVSYLARWTRLRAWSLAMALTATFKWASSRTLWEEYLILGEYFEISMTNCCWVKNKENEWHSRVGTRRIVWNVIKSCVLRIRVLDSLERSNHFSGEPEINFVILIFLGKYKFCLFWYVLHLPSLFVRSAMRRERPSNFSAGRITCQSWFQLS